jgi:amino acid transporter
MATPTTLKRVLGLRSLVFFGLAYMTPMIVLGIFGIVAEVTEGASASAYAVALVAMIFTAASYGRLSAAFPVSGSAYTYVRKTIDSRAGFAVGWAILLDYLFLPMVIWLIGAAYMQAQFPDVPVFVWLLAFISITTILNVIGLKVADRANMLLMAFQALVLILFVGFSVAFVLGGGGTGSLLDAGPFLGDNGSITAITAGAAIAAYSFLGFDAITTFTEETIEPKKTVPRAILLVAIIGGAIFIVVSYTTQLVYPGGTFEDVGSAALLIAGQIGGAAFSAIFLAGLIIAQFTSGLAAQASASRLLFAMGRDGVLPKKAFGAITTRFKTPVFNLVAIGGVGLIALFLDITTSTSFILFGAFLAFVMVNIAVIAHFVRERKSGRNLNAVTHVVFPLLGAIVCAYLLLQLDATAITLGLSWLGIGLVVLMVVTKFFRVAPPEVAAKGD